MQINFDFRCTRIIVFCNCSSGFIVPMPARVPKAEIGSSKFLTEDSVPLGQQSHSSHWLKMGIRKRQFLSRHSKKQVKLQWLAESGRRKQENRTACSCEHSQFLSVKEKSIKLSWVSPDELQSSCCSKFVHAPSVSAMNFSVLSSVTVTLFMLGSCI